MQTEPMSYSLLQGMESMVNFSHSNKNESLTKFQQHFENKYFTETQRIRDNRSKDAKLKHDLMEQGMKQQVNKSAQLKEI